MWLRNRKLYNCEITQRMKERGKGRDAEMGMGGKCKQEAETISILSFFFSSLPVSHAARRLAAGLLCGDDSLFFSEAAGGGPPVPGYRKNLHTEDI